MVIIIIKLIGWRRVDRCHVYGVSVAFNLYSFYSYEKHEAGVNTKSANNYSHVFQW